jgi:cell division protein FtsW (lipid II flippase)
MKRKFSIFMPKGYNKYIHGAMILLSFFGSLMVISANINHNSTPMSLLIVAVRQVGFFMIGYIAMVILARYWSWEFIKKHMLSDCGIYDWLAHYAAVFSQSLRCLGLDRNSRYQCHHSAFGVCQDNDDCDIGGISGRYSK